jgi:hypothetical protein
MAANFLNTNRNTDRYFFATSENGEQQLSLEYGTVGPFSTMSVAISGDQGNAVTVNVAPDMLANGTVLGQGSVSGGSSSTFLPYFYQNSSGFNISMDRIPGSGITTIENYGTNGAYKGFEFITHTTGGAILYNAMSTFMSTIGRPGATTVLGGTGTVATNSVVTNFQATPRSDLSGGLEIILYPAPRTNVEFGAAGPNNVVPITSVLTNMFSIPISALKQNTQTLLNINFANALSTATDALVTYKVGFSTATAYTNCQQTVVVGGGSWTPSDIPSATTPITYTNICCMIDSDGINPDGTATLYVDAQLANPSAAPDQIFIKKGLVTEPTRNALTWRSI